MEYILAEKVIFSGNDAVVPDIEDFLREMLAFAVRIQTQVAQVKGKAKEPLFGGEKLIDRPVGITVAITERIVD